jgi:uncharacterized protein YpmB
MFRDKGYPNYKKAYKNSDIIIIIIIIIIVVVVFVQLRHIYKASKHSINQYNTSNDRKHYLICKSKHQNI